MKNKFKVGDKVTPTNNEDFFFGKTGQIEEIKSFNGGIRVNYNDPSLNHDIGYYNPKGLKLSNQKTKQPSLTITIKPSTRNGVKSFRWEFKHANNKKANHSYNSKSSAKKELTKFLDSIKNEDYEIVIK